MLPEQARDLILKALTPVDRQIFSFLLVDKKKRSEAYGIQPVIDMPTPDKMTPLNPYSKEQQ